VKTGSNFVHFYLKKNHHFLITGQFRYLHPYVSQRLVSLFETLAKKHARLNEQLKEPLSNGGATDLAVNVMTNSEDMVSV
jgi:hypothetical protein